MRYSGEIFIGISDADFSLCKRLPSNMKLTIIVCFLCLISYTFQFSCNARSIRKSYLDRKSYEGTVSTPKFNISASDLEYGKDEVRRILRDRPQMGELVKEDDPIWTIAARAFAGEFASGRLKWVSREEFSLGVDAFHNWGAPVVEIYVNGHTKEGKVRSAQRCWSSLFFEIFNSSRYKENFVIRAEAINGKCSRLDYIRRSAKLEYLAQLQTFAFFKKVWRPRMVLGKTAIPIVWYCLDAELTYDEWVASWLKRDGSEGYPYGYFGQRYDQLMAKASKNSR